MYRQLTLAQRYVISSMRASGSAFQAIADEINRIEKEEAESRGDRVPKPRRASTISREYRRNRTKTGKYNPNAANEMAMERRERIVRNTALKPGVLQRVIRLLMEKRWSPEQISGSLALEGVRISTYTSTELPYPLDVDFEIAGESVCFKFLDNYRGDYNGVPFTYSYNSPLKGGIAIRLENGGVISFSILEIAEDSMTIVMKGSDTKTILSKK